MMHLLNRRSVKALELETTVGREKVRYVVECGKNRMSKCTWLTNNLWLANFVLCKVFGMIWVRCTISLGVHVVYQNHLHQTSA